MADVQTLIDELLAARREGKAAVARTADVNQAVAVARLLQEQGKAQWFRGQVRYYPKLVASYTRLDKKGQDAALQRLSRFSRWVKATPGLEDLAASYDAMMAVAQHHGLPTTFLDFTTDPEIAGFFASHATGDVAPGTEGCLYCLDINEADRIWDSVRRALGESHAVERVVLDVPNLWRLEAQKGVFVWSGNYADLNIPFPLDVILFPYRGLVAAPTEEQIYPKRESPLEALLREYFQNEEIREGSALLKTMMPAGLFNTLVTEGEPYLAKHFLAPPVPHASWDRALIEPWLHVRTEPLATLADARRLAFEIGPGETPADAAARIKAFVAATLAQEPTLRQAAVTWTVTAPGRAAAPNDRPASSLWDEIWAKSGLTGPVQSIWDGMARLPWSDAALATALAGAIHWRLTADNLSAGRAMHGRELEFATAKALLAAPVRVEIGGLGNAHNWAWLPEGELLAAIRDDFPSLIRPEDRAQIVGHSFNSMMVARTPALLFDFGRLAAAFASVMIPSQAVFGPQLPLFDNPARARVIGPS